MRALSAFSVFAAAIALTGCTPDPDARLEDRADRVCGEGNVAYIDFHDGQFGCKGTTDDD